MIQIKLYYHDMSNRFRSVCVVVSSDYSLLHMHNYTISYQQQSAEATKNISAAQIHNTKMASHELIIRS